MTPEQRIEQIKKEALDAADNFDIRGCAAHQGFYRGYIAGVTREHKDEKEKTVEEREGYGALGVLSKEEARYEELYDRVIKVGTLEGIKILMEFVRLENRIK